MIRHLEADTDESAATSTKKEIIEFIMLGSNSFQDLEKAALVNLVSADLNWASTAIIMLEYGEHHAENFLRSRLTGFSPPPPPIPSSPPAI